MKANVLSINGEKIKQIEMPGCFDEEIRHDLIKRAFESESSRQRQPYGTFPLAGQQSSSSGRVRHARRKYKTAYGFTISRVPRKVFSKRGGRFYWVGAFIPGTRGGRQAHPPKPEKVWEKKINKKEKARAVRAAIAATASIHELQKRYATIKQIPELKEISLPLVIESKFEGVKKTQELKKILEKILGSLTRIAFREKEIRAGRGKSRGRKHKTAKGILIISEKLIGSANGLRGYGVDNIDIKNINLINLAPSGVAGRLTLYTENAINAIKSMPKLK